MSTLALYETITFVATFYLIGVSVVQTSPSKKDTNK
jgi:hypothetical protein